jgi:hypothetical protein
MGIVFKDTVAVVVEPKTSVAAPVQNKVPTEDSDSKYRKRREMIIWDVYRSVNDWGCASGRLDHSIEYTYPGFVVYKKCLVGEISLEDMHKEAWKIIVDMPVIVRAYWSETSIGRHFKERSSWSYYEKQNSALKSLEEEYGTQKEDSVLGEE